MLVFLSRIPLASLSNAVRALSSLFRLVLGSNLTAKAWFGSSISPVLSYQASALVSYWTSYLVSSGIASFMEVSIVTLRLTPSKANILGKICSIFVWYPAMLQIGFGPDPVNSCKYRILSDVRDFGKLLASIILLPCNSSF